MSLGKKRFFLMKNTPCIWAHLLLDVFTPTEPYDWANIVTKMMSSHFGSALRPLTHDYAVYYLWVNLGMVEGYLSLENLYRYFSHKRQCTSLLHHHGHGIYISSGGQMRVDQSDRFRVKELMSLPTHADEMHCICCIQVWSVPDTGHIKSS